MSFQMIPCFPVASPKLANASFWAVFLAVLLSLNVAALASERAAENSPPSRRALSVLPSNPYFFQDTSGRPVTLVGDYTWGAFSDLNYDYVRFFDSLHARGLNVARVWLWWGCEEIASDPIPARHIEPYLRPGPGMANDDRPKYDLTRFNPAFFARLDAFCRAAKQRGIQLQLMAMDAWTIKHAELWRLHAFQRDNNINDVDGDPARTGMGTDGRRGFCSMGNPRVLAFQKALIRKIVETTNRFDNIHYEIANENYYSEEWELALCDYIKEIEKAMPRQHLTMRRDIPSHSYVVQRWDTAAIHTGMLEKRSLRQPLIFDTDWIINKNDDQVRKAMWTALASGGHFDYMDDSLEFRQGTPYKDGRAVLHKQIDYAAAFMKQIKPWEMEPDDALVKAGQAYVLASRAECTAYLPSGGSATLNLSGMKGSLQARWYNPREGKFSSPAAVQTGVEVEFAAPDTNDWSLLVSQRNQRLSGIHQENFLRVRTRGETLQPIYPGSVWETRTPEQAGLSRTKLEALQALAGGRGCVVRHGYLVYSWGDQARSGDVASAVKPLLSTLLLFAIQEGKVRSADSRVAEFEPRLKELNRGKDANILWRHFASQTSGYGLQEPPGKAWAYNDFALALYYDTLTTKVFRMRGDIVLKDRIAAPLQFQDPATFEAFGPADRPGRLAISVRDFARFGLFILRGGKWQGKQLLSPILLHKAFSSPVPAEMPRTAGVEVPMLPDQRSLGGGKNQTATGPGYYSFNWWLNGKNNQGKRLFADLPPDAFVASGHGGESMLWMVPSLDIIVSWNDANVDDQDTSPANPQTRCNQAAQLISAAVHDAL